MLSRADVFMVHGKMRVSFFCASELLHPKTIVGLQLIRAGHNFNEFSDNTDLSLAVVECSISNRRIAFRGFYHHKKCTQLNIILWSITLWRL